MNLQTELIDQHRAQLTIEIEPERLEKAKRQAARQISRQVSIRGFRKGKAPYRLVAQRVGESFIVEEALEALGVDLYKQALEESDISPYGPGDLEDIKLEPAPTFIFSVPLQPEVDLKDYAQVRLDFEAPSVSDEEVDQALQQLRMHEIEVLDAEAQVAEIGHRARVAVESVFVDDGETQPDDSDHSSLEADETDEPPADESDEADEESEEAVYHPRKGDSFVNDQDATVILDPDEDPFMDGFVDALIGAELNSEREFELTIPDDDADETIRNRRVSFKVKLNQIEAISIPELDDDFAEMVSKNRGDELLDMAGLRRSARDELERAGLDRALSAYSFQVLQEMVKGAEIAYPDMMVEERIDELVADAAAGLERQGLNIDDFYRLSGTSEEEFRDRHRERAISSLRESLAIREFAREQGIEVADEEIELRLDLVASGYGLRMRQMFDSPQMRENLHRESLMSHIYAQLSAVGRGQDPQEASAALRAKLEDDLRLARERSDRMAAYMRAEGEEEDGEEDAEPSAEAGEESGAPDPASEDN